MKKFIIKTLTFVAILILADFIIGRIYGLYDYVKGGEIGKTHHIMTGLETDILIIGSSRASHHYNPDIISKELGMDVYNAGFDGKGTLLEYGLVTGVTSRSKPRLIVCELLPQMDIYKDAASSSINILAPYSSEFKLDTLFHDIDYTNDFKMLSKSYQYNSVLFRILPNLISDRTHYLGGYAPLKGKFNKRKDSTPTVEQPHEIDSVKVKYFHKIIQKAIENKCMLVFMMSPTLETVSDEYYKPMLDIAESHNIKVFNHLKDTAFTNHPDLFNDLTHMNSDGADKYSKTVAREIAGYLRNPQ